MTITTLLAPKRFIIALGFVISLISLPPAGAIAEPVVQVTVTLTIVGGNEPITPGDIDNDSDVDMTDAVLALQCLGGIETSVPIFVEADVNNDGIISLEEVIYILREISGLRFIEPSP